MRRRCYSLKRWMWYVCVNVVLFNYFVKILVSVTAVMSFPIDLDLLVLETWNKIPWKFQMSWIMLTMLLYIYILWIKILHYICSQTSVQVFCSPWCLGYNTKRELSKGPTHNYLHLCRQREAAHLFSFLLVVCVSLWDIRYGTSTFPSGTR